MYSEEIKYLSRDSDDNTHVNKIRNAYFENRSCLTNVLDFLDQEVVIMPSSYFSYEEGLYNIMEDSYIYVDTDQEMDRFCLVSDSLCRVSSYNGYHLSILDNYVTIVANNMRCIFTNKDMEEGTIIGTVIWVKNFNELLKKFGDRNLKRISKAIVCPLTKKLTCSCCSVSECLNEEFFLSMDIYYPGIVFKYTIDTYMSNLCIDVYNKLEKCGLNGLVDKYIPSYNQCDGYGKKDKETGYSRELCKCGGLRVFCYLDI
ncbi:hypothetical protein CONCODRAFT_2567 [Conidiobolus coronatus NRRL 28638]|uniref:Uncharacterized protein n=1 Tax=Conidiobolus coronatus (strain ATCC 28846 / CBS 209.66 / NRRL 28638) TaxID=796925 RepID=A0A137PH87_CONC2|nr:hypothetical protein CONCODRAFT_2567 [Conidiobolus coronatus NRRL 28638]|eukprot:KXN74363.1 hypothetical protein CONCODRAFT_2567 [Conidiobolus coronatus NRRL 28638]